MSQRIKLEEAKLEDLPEIQRIAEVTWEACYPGIISEGQISYMLDRGYQLDVLQKDIEEHNIRFVLARIDNEAVGFGAHGINSECDQIKLHKDAAEQIPGQKEKHTGDNIGHRRDEIGTHLL